ncbi:MAG: hypothetical protein ACOZNI_27355 [Myxococcota bacterium]
MSPVDVALVWPGLATNAVELSAADRVSSEIALGALADVRVAKLKRASLLGGAGVRFWTAGVEADGRVVRATVADLELEIVERWGPGWTVATEGQQGIHWELGAGPHLVMLGSDRIALHLNPALGLHTGFGGYVGKGDTRALLGFRVSATLRTDQYWGSLVGATEDVSWEYWPGRLSLELYGGVGLR